MEIHPKEFPILFVAAILALLNSSIANQLINKYTTDTMDENDRIAALQKFRLRQLKALSIILIAFCIGFALSHAQNIIPWRILVPTLLIIYPYFAQGGYEIQTWGGNSSQEKIDKIWNWTISFVGVIWLTVNILV